MTISQLFAAQEAKPLTFPMGTRITWGNADEYLLARMVQEGHDDLHAGLVSIESGRCWSVRLADIKDGKVTHDGVLRILGFGSRDWVDDRRPKYLFPGATLWGTIPEECLTTNLPFFGVGTKIRHPQTGRRLMFLLPQGSVFPEANVGLLDIDSGCLTGVFVAPASRAFTREEAGRFSGVLDFWNYEIVDKWEGAPK